MTATVTATSDSAEPLADCRPVRCLALDFGTIGLRELDHLIGQRPVDPGVVEPLRLLYKRVGRLVLARSTLPYETRWPALQQAGVDDLFSCALLSHSLKVNKKATAGLYSMVIAAAECEPDEILFVGDSVCRDVVGPMRAGMRAALIRPCGMRPGETLPAGALQIRHVADLLDLPGLW